MGAETGAGGGNELLGTAPMLGWERGEERRGDKNHVLAGHLSLSCWLQQLGFLNLDIDTVMNAQHSE